MTPLMLASPPASAVPVSLSSCYSRWAALSRQHDKGAAEDCFSISAHRSPWKMCLAFALLLGVIPSGAQAACTGSGTSWSCTAGSSGADVNSALSSATDGATITLAAGSYSWGSTLKFSVSKGATVMCATKGACTVSMKGPLWQWANFGSSSKLYRISGFVFNGVSPYFIWLYSTGSGAATLTQLRFDNNVVNVASSASDIVTFGEVTGLNTTIQGVIDHNTFRTTTGNTRWLVMYSQSGSAGAWPMDRIGTANNLFVEDNTFDDQCMVNAGNAALDTDGGPHTWVVRHNTFINSRIEHHGYYWSFPGPANSEVYNNNYTHNCGQIDGSYSIKHQGSGEWIVFSNTVTATGGKGAAHILQNYRSFYDFADQCNGSNSEDSNRSPTATNQGYPCKRQPGRNAAAQLRPQYYWNNRWGDGTAITVNISCPNQGTMPVYCPQHIQANRDYYQGGVAPQTSPTSPFNGTGGTGFGTLANRPATCTTGAEAGGGVAYWATDTSTLYRCSATNTWTAYYRPYVYPHPLVQDGSAPSPPTSLRIVQ